LIQGLLPGKIDGDLRAAPREAIDIPRRGRNLPV